MIPCQCTHSLVPEGQHFCPRCQPEKLEEIQVGAFRGATGEGEDKLYTFALRHDRQYNGYCIYPWKAPEEGKPTPGNVFVDGDGRVSVHATLTDLTPEEWWKLHLAVRTAFLEAETRGPAFRAARLRRLAENDGGAQG